jgi:archaemetzincin
MAAERPGRPAIAVWWIGEGALDGGLVGPLGERLAVEYECSVAVEDPGERPAGTFDAVRRQHSSREVLRWLAAEAPRCEGRLLGVTNVDLFIPILTFVFGEAQLEGRAAVVSSARLVHEDPRVTAARLAREGVHEIGHTFGLRHCDASNDTGRGQQPCVMARSASVRAVDVKGNRLCADCRTRYRLFQQDGTHVYREHENPCR